MGVHYYALISISVIMFGTTFLFKRKFKESMGSGADATFISTLIAGVVGLITFLIINKAEFDFTPFTFIMAFLSALNGILFSFCTLKAFESINLSLYSVFSMLGGMMLPFVYGMIFRGEPFTLPKTVCVIFILFALLITIEKGHKKGVFAYYAGVFILNGMSGVLSTIHQSAPFPTTNSAVYSIWISVISIIISIFVLIIIRKNLKKPSMSAILYSAGSGVLNRIANYLLLIALIKLDASLQYPFVTGGTMIVSTFFSAVTGQKPSWRELVSVALSFIGILALVLL